jgi:hypothetical protein
MAAAKSEDTIGDHARSVPDQAGDAGESRGISVMDPAFAQIDATRASTYGEDRL